MLTDADLAYMRSAVSGLMPDRCNILTPILGSDGQGGQEITWGTVAANVPCRLDPGRQLAGETVQGAAVMPYGYAILTLPYETALVTEQRIEARGMTYNVVSVDTGKSWEVTRRAVVMPVEA